MFIRIHKPIDEVPEKNEVDSALCLPQRLPETNNAVTKKQLKCCTFNALQCKSTILPRRQSTFTPDSPPLLIIKSVDSDSKCDVIG